MGKALKDCTDEELLDELVARGRIHSTRALKHHLITFTEEFGEGYWSMSHPLSCDLSDCEYNRAAEDLTNDPDARLVPGTYRWPKPHWSALRKVEKTP